MPDDIAQEQRFWSDHKLLETPYIHYDQAEYSAIVKLLGDSVLENKKILEIGCGAGVWTANLSRLAAQVYYFDLSPEIVISAGRYANSHQVYGFCADMHHLPFSDGSFDLIFGSMVLHHAVDHSWLGRELCRVLKPGGKAVFHENSARNPILMLARGTLVGRWGIPKNSSPGEHPLRPSEIAQVGQAFQSTHVIVARMVFFQMAVKYLFKRETGAWHRFSRRLDRWLYCLLPFTRPLSYYQILEFKKSGVSCFG